MIFFLKSQFLYMMMKELIFTSLENHQDGHTV